MRPTDFCAGCERRYQIGIPRHKSAVLKSEFLLLRGECFRPFLIADFKFGVAAGFIVL